MLIENPNNIIAFCGERGTGKAGGYGYRNVGFILDRGYFSKENIHYMDKCGYEFIIMMKGMKELVKSLVLEVKGTFEEDRKYSIRDYKVSGITVKNSFIRQTKRNVISTFFIVTERKAWNMRLLKQRLTEWPNAFISMKAQSMRSKAEVLPDTLT